LVPQMTLQQVLEEAIHKEVLAHLLYIGLQQRVKNPASIEVFQSLAEQEEIHQKILERYLHGELKEGALSTGLVVDYKIAEHLDQPEVTPTMDLKEVFLLAANKEKASHELYQSLSAIHPNGKVKHLLDDLAAQELEHKRRIETLYTEVAFPQTDGG
jgi:rubrerythrin